MNVAFYWCFIGGGKKGAGPVRGGCDIPFDGRRGGAEVGVRQGGNEADSPVELLAVRNFSCFRNVGWRLSNVGVEGDEGIKYVAAHRKPFHCHPFRRHIGAELGECEEVIPVDADGAVPVSAVLIALSSIAVVGGALVMTAQDIFHVVHSDFLLRHIAPGKVVRFRRHGREGGRPEERRGD